MVERQLSGQLEKLAAQVAQRGPQTEIGAVLKTVQDMQHAAPPPAPLQAAPLGKIYVNQTRRTDAATGREYTQLVEGPWYLSRTEAAGEHRTLHDVPSFQGTGMTLSFWYRHVECEAVDCGVYLFVARNAAAWCWSFWLENTAWSVSRPSPPAAETVCAGRA